MNANISKQFVDKAIQKTKSYELDWCPISDSFNVKPLPDENLSITHTAAHAVMRAMNPLLTQYSYRASFKGGELVLLLFGNGLMVTPPPDGCDLSLRVQDAESRFAAEIANSNESNEHAQSLIRLYNLIDKRSPSLNTLINDFLNS